MSCSICVTLGVITGNVAEKTAASNDTGALNLLQAVPQKLRKQVADARGVLAWIVAL